MAFFLKNFFIFLSIIEITPLIDSDNYEDPLLLNIHLPVFIICFILNFYFNQSIKYNLNFDLVFKYFFLFLKNPSTLLNYSLNTFKKIYIFLYHFKYRHIRKSILIFSKKYSSKMFLFWKPLFKKSSYFGYFRSNRSKWIK